MPVLDGYTVVRKLRQNPATARMPIIFVTGLDFDALGPLRERSAVLRKPCPQGEILEAIQKVLASTTSPPPAGVDFLWPRRVSRRRLDARDRHHRAR